MSLYVIKHHAINTYAVEVELHEFLTRSLYEDKCY